MSNLDEIRAIRDDAQTRLEASADYKLIQRLNALIDELQGETGDAEEGGESAAAARSEESSSVDMPSTVSSVDDVSLGAAPPASDEQVSPEETDEAQDEGILSGCGIVGGAAAATTLGVAALAMDDDDGDEADDGKPNEQVHSDDQALSEVRSTIERHIAGDGEADGETADASDSDTPVTETPAEEILAEQKPVQSWWSADKVNALSAGRASARLDDGIENAAATEPSDNMAGSEDHETPTSPRAARRTEMRS